MRLDRLLVDKGLVRSRQEAEAAITAGRVLVNGLVVRKPSREVRAGDAVRLLEGGPRYVSRGGWKLRAALRRFAVSPLGRVCLDSGASTGGFTDCLLQHGARRVYAVDVGYGQLAWSLRQDPRVVVRERTNLRSVRPEDFPEPIELATLDLSFIGLEKVLPAVRALLSPEGEVLALVKPQFEVGPQGVGKGGVVRSPDLHLAALSLVARRAQAIGLFPVAAMASPILGPKGNVEFFLHLTRHPAPRLDEQVLRQAVEEGRLLVQEKNLRRVEANGREGAGVESDPTT